MGVGEKGEGGRPHGGRPARGGPRAAQQAAKRPLWQKCTSCSRFPATNGNHPPNPGRPPARRCSVFSPNSTIFCYIILLFMFFFYKTAWAPKFAAAADEATADDGLSCPPPLPCRSPKSWTNGGLVFVRISRLRAGWFLLHPSHQSRHSAFLAVIQGPLRGVQCLRPFCLLRFPLKPELNDDQVESLPPPPPEKIWSALASHLNIAQ